MGRDKSLTHRAILFASLARGESIIGKGLLSADCLATIECFRSMGVAITVEEKSGEIHIQAKGIAGLQNPSLALDCQNSGTTARLLLGLLAGVSGFSAILTGDDSLRSRPMKRVTAPLSEENAAQFKYIETDDHLPIAISGRQLGPSRYQITTASAQIKSALLLAGISTAGHTTVCLPIGSRDHTERFVKFLGGSCHSSIEGDFETVTLRGPFSPKNFRCQIPADPSSAAFFAVLGLLVGTGQKTLIPEVLANPTRCGFIEVLTRMAGNRIVITKEPGDTFVEDTVLLEITGCDQISGTDIAKAEVPGVIDELPILAVLAAFAHGPSTFFGLSELRVKESDRLQKTYELLDKAGAAVSIQGDDLLISGGLTQVESFDFDPLGDHRLAMCASILNYLCDGQCQIVDPDCVKVSFPTFYEELAKFERDV